MAAQVCNNRPKVMDDDDDDDDVPIVFRRSSGSSAGGAAASSRQGRANPAPKKMLSPPHVSRNVEGGPGTQKGRPLPAAKVTKEGSASSVSARKPDKPKAPAERSRTHAADSDESDDDKPLSMRFSAASPSGQTKSPARSSGNPDGDADDDSDDDKPLSFRKSMPASGGQKKNGSLQLKKEIPSPGPSSTFSQRMPSSKFSVKPSPGSSIKKSYDSDEEKPLCAKYPQNGFHKDLGLAAKSSKDPSKRPLSGVSDSVQSSNKKVKVSDASGTSKVKHEPVVKKEIKMHDDDDDDDHVPISQRIKKTVSSGNQSSTKKVLKKVISTTSFKKDSKKLKKETRNSKFSKSSKMPPGSGGGRKWTTLVHNGVIFPPPYKPHRVKMLYNGQPVDLTPEQEEVATMFAVMKDTDYATKPTFIENFFNDWKAVLGKNHVIKKFELCDFTPIYEWHLKEKDKKKQMSSEEKKALKEEKLKQEENYMWAVVDDVKEKVGNFRVEPPGLFRGRGEHPKMGKLKKRILPRDITINIGKSAPIPECPIPGERWKEVKHDNTVTWLAYWNDPINSKEFKYVFLAASSSLKGQSDKQKYEKARKLKDYIDAIRSNYTRDFTSRDEIKRQIAVATYLIDKLALRAGNEKDEDEAETVGCCTLKIENVKLIPPNKLEFDFLGKDSVRYFNTVEVELPVCKAIGDFCRGRKKGEDLFDKLDTSKLNAHLKELMPGLTAKVFRTYNASITLDKMLNTETKDGSIPEKVAIYQKANKEVAIICNHQRTVSKGHDNTILKYDETISKLQAQKKELLEDLNRAKKGKSASGNPTEKIRNQISKVDEKIKENEVKKATKEELKTIALGTSKTNYCDPRISVSWCKRHEVPIEKVFTKSLCAKFAWAMDADPSFRF